MDITQTLHVLINKKSLFGIMINSIPLPNKQNPKRNSTLLIADALILRQHWSETQSISFRQIMQYILSIFTWFCLCHFIFYE